MAFSLPEIVNYAEAAQFLYALAPRGISLGLARVDRALAQRKHPERACPAVLVAGTNGKGSVANMIAAVLQASGLRVGLYTSPHLHRLSERFRVNGKALAQREFAARVSELRPWLEAESTPALTFFEACTVLAFEVFRDARCDVMVLEVGLGGRLDATNVVRPRMTVITSIALDHADRLGPTLTHIAREKAGIIKPRVPVVVGARAPEAQRVIRARARRMAAPALLIDRDFACTRAGEQLTVRVRERSFERLALPLRGAYQADNLTCAVAALARLKLPGFALDAATLRKGLRGVRWPGRLELVKGAPDVLLDAAHNHEAAQALARHLAEAAAHYPRRVLLFAVMRDKEHAEMLALLRPHFADIVFTTPATARALPARELAALYGGQAVDPPERAFKRAQKLAGKRGLVVVAGSIFVMAAVRAQVLGLRSDPPIAM